MTEQEMVQLAKDKAAAYQIDPALFCALVETESGWYAYSNRYESGFFKRYIQKMLPANKGDKPTFYPPKPRGNTSNATEAENRATSFGLCQVMGQVARELGCKVKSLTELCNPEVGLEFGAKRLKKALDRKKGDVREALLNYNGGADKAYPDRVLANMPKFQ